MINKLSIRDNKSVTADPEVFIKILRKYDRIKFENETLKADVRHLESKNSHRETKITYYWKLNGQWQDFAFFCSKSIQQVIEDFKYEFHSLQIA